MTELVVLGYRFDQNAEEWRVSAAHAAARRLGIIVDAVRFGWSPDGRLGLRRTDDARTTSRQRGLAIGLVAGVLPGAALRAGLVREGGTDDALGHLVRHANDALGPGGVESLGAYLEDARQGMLLVVRPGSDAPEGEQLPGDAETIRIVFRGDERALLRAVGAAMTRPDPFGTTVVSANPDGPADPGAPVRTVVVPDLRAVWRTGIVVICLVLLYVLGAFVLQDGGALIFQLFMSFLASIAMEPAVSRLARHMSRGLATGGVMLGVVVFFVIFFVAFGNLLVQQVTSLASALPGAVESITGWANRTFDLSLDPATLASKLQVSPADVASIGAEVAGGVLGLIAQLVGGIFSLFTIGLFIFYFSADAPRLKRWTARLLPPRYQEVFIVIWDVAVKKTGGYVSARIILAGICGGFTSVFLLLIGMDYWLALGVWTGVVSQFVPTIGTYIAIALPVIVGLTSSQPTDGVLALAFALVYQQIENLTIEPRISADAVDMHPAVAFASVLLGASLFGVGGALVAVPMAALGLTLFEIYSRTYDLLPQLGSPALAAPPVEASARRSRRWSLRKG